MTLYQKFKKLKIDFSAIELDKPVTMINISVLQKALALLAELA